MIEANCPNSLEGKHILNILENEKRKVIYKFDGIFAGLFCAAKCPEYKDVWIGSLECHRCPKFVSEENSEGFSSIITCKE